MTHPNLTDLSPRELIRGLMRGNRSELKLGYSPANAVLAVARLKGLDLKDDTRIREELRGYSQDFSDGMRPHIQSMVVDSDPDTIENTAYREGYRDGELEPVALTYPSNEAI